MQIKEFPILEFDSDKNPFIKPSGNIAPIDIAERCVLCFFSEAIENILNKHPHKIAAYFKAESLKLPMYELEYKGGKIALIQAGVGAPIAAGQIEELCALGCRKFIACGSCGVLREDIAVGHLIIPSAAVRDEGTSYHYIEPSREVEADAHIVREIESALAKRNVPYITAKTWTTDALYRETQAKIKQRKAEGCVTVEMECSAYIAAARYNNVEFGQILYAGDNLGGSEWDSRGYSRRTDIRGMVLGLALDVCMGI